MPNINEFIGPKPSVENLNGLEKVVGNKPCGKCDLDVSEYFWDPAKYTMTWTCSSGHLTTVTVNS